MTQYKQTVAKRKGGMQSTPYQTGLLPALPAVGSALSGAGAAVGLGSLAGKAKNLFTASKAGKAASATSKAGAAAGGAAKLGISGIALNEFNKFMNTGPTVGGVNILPLAAVGGVALLGANSMLGGGIPTGLMIPLAGAGVLVGGLVMSKN